MGTNFRLLLVTVPVMLFAHIASSSPFAQSEHTSIGQNAPALPSNDDWTRAPSILQAADSWRIGDPLPPELRRFRWFKSDLPDPMESSLLIAQVRNLPLLAALVLDPGADPECREDALSQGIEVGGPRRFFGLLRPQLSSAAAKNIQPWINELRGRMARPHTVVDALFISFKDMSRQQALAVIAKITSDLRRGAPWNDVYKKYSEKFKIGLYGPLVVFPDPALGSGHLARVTYSSDGSQHEVLEWEGTPLPRRLGGLEFFDPTHLPMLLKASVGDVVSLPSELHHEYVLYWVEEVYGGDPEARPK